MFGRTVQDHQYASVVIPAEQGRIRVLSLPEPCPSDFSGIVGKPLLSAEADMREAYVGDPVTYRLIIGGVESGDIEPIPLNRIDDFTSRFRIPEHHSPPLKENGKTVFVYTIRPLSADVTEIPAYRCSYFNPETERYETVETKILPLTVYPSPAARDSQIEEFFPGADGPEKITLEQVKNQIPAMESGKKLLRREDRFPYRITYRVLYGLAFPVTFLPFLAAVVYAVRRRRPQTRAERRREMRKAVIAIRYLDDSERLPRLFRLAEDYKDVVSDSALCGREIERLKKILFSGEDFSSEETDSIFEKMEEELR